MANEIVLLFILGLKFVSSKDPLRELPLCPTNIQFLPQALPMHCRMPRNANLLSFSNGGDNQQPTMPPFIPPYYQSPPPGKGPAPLPFPVPPGLPMMPGFPMPGPMPGPIPGPMPGPIPGPMPGPIPIPGGPAHKLPVIVMPFYSPDESYAKNRKREKKPIPKPNYYSEDTDTESSEASSDTDPECSPENESSHEHSRGSRRGSDSDHGWWKSKKGFRRNYRKSHRHRGHRLRRKRPHEMVTPILQYVNNDGYVIFEKKITKNEAKEWLKGDQQVQNVNKQNENDDNERKERDEEDKEFVETFIQEDNKENKENRAEEKSLQRQTELSDNETVEPKIKKHRTHAQQKPSNPNPKELLKDKE